MFIEEFRKINIESGKERERTFYKIKCDICQDIFEVSKSNYNNRKNKKNDEFHCKKCSKTAISTGKKNYKGTPIHNSYVGAKQRCNYKKHIAYKNYRGRGIEFTWKSFESFRKDMEDTWFEGATIERKNVNKNYCKENCIWIPQSHQARNTRRTLHSIEQVKLIKKLYKDKKYTQTELSKIFNDSQGNISNIITNKTWI